MISDKSGDSPDGIVGDDIGTRHRWRHPFDRHDLEFIFEIKLASRDPAHACERGDRTIEKLHG
jgi:hypothetical protein